MRGRGEERGERYRREKKGEGEIKGIEGRQERKRGKR